MALYGLTTQTAADLKRVISHGDRLGAAVTPRDVTTGVTWVKVTGTPDGDGWHPAVVSIDDGGTWVDGTAEVRVAAADGSDLAAETRYLCTRTGDTDDDVARFRAVTPTPALAEDPQTHAAGGLDYGVTAGDLIAGVEFDVGDVDTADPRVTVLRVAGGADPVLLQAGATVVVEITDVTFAAEWGAWWGAAWADVQIVQCEADGTLIDAVTDWVPAIRTQLRAYNGTGFWSGAVYMEALGDTSSGWEGMEKVLTGQAVIERRLPRPEEDTYYTLRVRAGAEPEGFATAVTANVRVISYGFGPTWLRADPRPAAASGPLP